MKKLMFFVITIALFFTLSNAQIITKTYPELSEIMPFGPELILKTIDNGYALVGSSTSDGVAMAKLNSEYEIQWKKNVFTNFGRTNTTGFYQDSSGYYYVGGIVGDWYNYIIKVDTLGNIIKKIIWRPENSESASMQNFILSKDSLIVLHGSRFNNIPDSTFYYVVLLDKELEIILEKQVAKAPMEGSEEEKIRLLGIYSAQNGFLIIGRNSYGTILKKLENRNIVWEKHLYDNVFDRFLPVNCRIISDGFLIIGKTKDYKPGVVKISKLGDLIWFKEFEITSTSTNRYSLPINCWESKDMDGYVIVCTEGNDFASVKILIIKVDYGGEILWQHESPGAADAALYLENGNIVCVGRNRQRIACLNVFYHDKVKIDIEPVIPKSILLFQNYPNPFNSSTKIEYQIDKTTNIQVIIYNITGQKIKTLFQGFKKPGNYSIIWKGKNEQGKSVISGIYICQLITSKQKKSRKLILIR